MTTPKFPTGANIQGPLEFDGDTGTRNSIVTGGSAPAHTEFSDLTGEQWGAIGGLSRDQQTVPYQLVVTWGDSNMVGRDVLYTTDREGADASHSKVLEVSRGDPTNLFRVPAAGQLMRMVEPCQDNHIGGYNSASARLTMGRRMVELDPGIKEVAFLNHAKDGSGFVSGGVGLNGAWNVGDVEMDALLADITTFLDAHPHYELTVIAASEGAIEGFETSPQVTTNEHRDFLIAAVNAIRTQHARAANAVFVIMTIHPDLLADVANLSMPAVDASIRAVGTNITPAGSAAFVDMSSQTDSAGSPPDERHFTADGLKFAGRRLAEAALTLRNAAANRRKDSLRMLYDPSLGRFADEGGAGCRIHDEVLEWDGEMGMCLSAGSDVGLKGFQTDIPVNNAEHTMFMRLKVTDGDLIATSPLMAGKTPTNTGIARLVRFNDISHEGGAGITVTGLQTGGANELFPDTWHSFAFTFTGTTFSAWRDGVKIVDGSTDGVAVITEVTCLELFDFDDGAGNQVTALCTDIRVMPYVAADDEIASWHADLPVVGRIVASSLTLGDDFRSVRDLGNNPPDGANGRCWKNQLASGLYYVTLNAADVVGPPEVLGVLSSARDLPWDPNTWFNGNPANGQVGWYIQLDVRNDQSAYATVKTLGLSPDESVEVTRAWTARLDKAVIDTEWTVESPWTEITKHEIDLGQDPADGGDWDRFTMSGTYYATYTGNPVSRGLPWNSGAWGTEAASEYKFNLDVKSDTTASIVATTSATSSINTTKVTRSWTAGLAKAAEANLWTMAYDWVELTPYVDDGADVQVLSVTTGTPTYVDVT